AQFTTAGVLLKMDTDFPDGDVATIRITVPSPKAFTLAVRRPVWAGDRFEVKLNGVAVQQPPLASLYDSGAGGRGNSPGNEAIQRQASPYVELKRTWKTGDTVDLKLPKSLRLEPTPDNRQVAAIMWGPLVLAGDLGPRRDRRGATPEERAVEDAAALAQVPVLVAADRSVTEWVTPSGSHPGDFRVQQGARVLAQPLNPMDVPPAPFFPTHRRNYSVYFDILTTKDFEERAASAKAK